MDNIDDIYHNISPASGIVCLKLRDHLPGVLAIVVADYIHVDRLDIAILIKFGHSTVSLSRITYRNVTYKINFDVTEPNLIVRVKIVDARYDLHTGPPWLNFTCSLSEIWHFMFDGQNIAELSQQIRDY